MQGEQYNTTKKFHCCLPNATHLCFQPHCFLMADSDHNHTL